MKTIKLELMLKQAEYVQLLTTSHVLEQQDHIGSLTVLRKEGRREMLIVETIRKLLRIGLRNFVPENQGAPHGAPRPMAAMKDH
jgi:hypothetical protein